VQGEVLRIKGGLCEPGENVGCLRGREQKKKVQWVDNEAVKAGLFIRAEGPAIEWKGPQVLVVKGGMNVGS